MQYEYELYKIDMWTTNESWVKFVIHSVLELTSHLVVQDAWKLYQATIFQKNQRPGCPRKKKHWQPNQNPQRKENSIYHNKEKKMFFYLLNKATFFSWPWKAEQGISLIYNRCHTGFHIIMQISHQFCQGANIAKKTIFRRSALPNSDVCITVKTIFEG